MAELEVEGWQTPEDSFVSQRATQLTIHQGAAADSGFHVRRLEHVRVVNQCARGCHWMIRIVTAFGLVWLSTGSLLHSSRP